MKPRAAGHHGRPWLKSVAGLALMFFAFETATCSGGDGGAGGATGPGGKPPANGGNVPPGGGTPPQNTTLTAWAISTAGNTGSASNLLEAGDSFRAETDTTTARSLWDAIWDTLTSRSQWAGSNPLNTYRFEIDSDPRTNWGRAYRYSGYQVLVGPIRTPFGGGVIVGSGTYRRVDGRSYDAMILQTWDDTYWQLLVFADSNTFVIADQHIDGYPIIETYRGQ